MKYSSYTLLALAVLVTGSLIAPQASFAETVSKPNCDLSVRTATGDADIDEKSDASHVYVARGEELFLSWESDHAKSAKLNGKTVDTDGVATVTPKKKTTYTVTFKSGSKSESCGVTAYIAGATLTSDTSTASVRPHLSGTAYGVKTVYVSLKKEGSTKIAWKGTAKVSKGVWKANVSKKLSRGTYEVTVAGAKSFDISALATNTLTVGVASSPSKPDSTTGTADTTFVVSNIPLLAGGNARAGTAVPIQYLQITNIGKKAATLMGFTVTQKGTAKSSVVGSLSTVDDVGGSRGGATSTSEKPLFKNGSAFVPTSASFAPGQMRLFTIKAHVLPNIADNLGKNLMLQLTGVSSDAKALRATLPIRGTTWIITQ